MNHALPVCGLLTAVVSLGPLAEVALHFHNEVSHWLTVIVGIVPRDLQLAVRYLDLRGNEWVGDLGHRDLFLFRLLGSALVHCLQVANYLFDTRNSWNIYCRVSARCVARDEFGSYTVVTVKNASVSSSGPPHGESLRCDFNDLGLCDFLGFLVYSDI